VRDRGGEVPAASLRRNPQQIGGQAIKRGEKERIRVSAACVGSLTVHAERTRPRGRREEVFEGRAVAHRQIESQDAGEKADELEKGESCVNKVNTRRRNSSTPGSRSSPLSLAKRAPPHGGRPTFRTVGGVVILCGQGDFLRKEVRRPPGT